MMNLLALVVSIPPAFLSMEPCNRESTIIKMEYPDWTQKAFKIYWSDRAGKSCPGPDHPRMMIEHPEVQQWVQITDVNFDFQNLDKKISEDPSHQLFPGSKNWISLDVSSQNRARKHFFYTDNEQSSWHDNPNWPGGNYPRGLRWFGRLYGLRKNSEGLLTPVFGLSWGFGRGPHDEKPHPIRPISIGDEAWQIDRPALKRLAAQWKVKDPF